jgi:hypothetical protein
MADLPVLDDSAVPADDGAPVAPTVPTSTSPKEVALIAKHHVEVDNANRKTVHLQQVLDVPKEVLNGDNTMTYHIPASVIQKAGGPASMAILHPHRVDMKVKSLHPLGVDLGIGTKEDAEDKDTFLQAHNPTVHIDVNNNVHQHHLTTAGHKNDYTEKTLHLVNTNTPKANAKNMASVSQQYYNMDVEDAKKDMQSMTKDGVTKYIVPVDSPMGTLAKRNGMMLDQVKGVAKPFKVIPYAKKGETVEVPHYAIDEKHKTRFLDDLENISKKDGLNVIVNGVGGNEKREDFTTGTRAVVDLTIHRTPTSFNAQHNTIDVHNQVDPDESVITPRKVSHYLGGHHRAQAMEAADSEMKTSKTIKQTEDTQRSLENLLFSE